MAATPFTWRSQAFALIFAAELFQRRPVPASRDDPLNEKPTDTGRRLGQPVDRPAYCHANSRALLRGRWSEAGRVHPATFTTIGRKQRFTNWDTAAFVARHLADSQTWPDARLLCWVLIPDHVHVLIEPGRAEDLSRAVGRAKAMVSRHWPEAYGNGDALWSPGFHDRAIRQDEALRDVARYFVANPVRAGLVRRVGDYPDWDAVWLSPPRLQAGRSGEAGLRCFSSVAGKGIRGHGRSHRARLMPLCSTPHLWEQPRLRRSRRFISEGIRSHGCSHGRSCFPTVRQPGTVTRSGR